MKVNLIGYWQKSLSKPLWIMTSLEPERGLEIYQKRIKIEQTFRDCKDLLHLTKLINKKQALLEQMIALALIAYVIGLVRPFEMSCMASWILLRCQMPCSTSQR